MNVSVGPVLQQRGPGDQAYRFAPGVLARAAGGRHEAASLLEQHKDLRGNNRSDCFHLYS